MRGVNVRAKRWLTATVDFVWGIGERKIFTFAAAAAFYLFLALVPMLGLICALLPYTPITEEIFLSYVGRFVPESLYEIFSSIIASIYRGSAATLSITAVASLWAASQASLALMRGMDAAEKLTRRENFIIFRLRACFFIVIMLATVLMTLCAVVYGGNILELIESKFADNWPVRAVVSITRSLRYPVMMMVLLLVFLCLYKWMPAGRRRLLDQWPGAIFATGAWLVFSYVFSVYNLYADKYGIYGALGTFIVAMLWVYYLLFILLMGAYINKIAEDRRAKRRSEGWE